MKRYLGAALLVPLILEVPLMADSPKSAPATYRVYSLNRRYFAELNFPASRTTVFEANGGRRLWEIPGWYRVAAVSNDGKHLVIGYDGSNLLELNASPEEVMLTFYREGTRTGIVRLKDLVPDTARLERTASHLRWGEYLGFDEQGRYHVKTAGGETFIFDPDTARAVR